jgi:chromosome segregation ATPase
MRRQFSGRSAPPSLRAQIVLMLSAFVFGGVLSALLFVGIWRHTAAESDRAQAAQVESRHALQAAHATLSRTETELASTRAAVASIRRDRARLALELTSLRRVNHRAARSLPQRLQAIADDADVLARETAKLASALTTLGDYLRNASATGVDPAFLEAQVGYLVESTTATRGTVASLAEQAQRASTAAAALRRQR